MATTLHEEDNRRGGSSPSPSTSSSVVVVAIPLYDRFTALDAIGPYELLHMVPGVTVLFLGQEAGQLFVADNGMLKLPATASFADVTRPDILVVPGGPGCFVAAKDPALISWINQVSTYLYVYICMYMYMYVYVCICMVLYTYMLARKDCRILHITNMCISPSRCNCYHLSTITGTSYRISFSGFRLVSTLVVKLDGYLMFL